MSLAAEKTILLNEKLAELPRCLAEGDLAQVTKLRLEMWDIMAPQIQTIVNQLFKPQDRGDWFSEAFIIIQELLLDPQAVAKLGNLTPGLTYFRQMIQWRYWDDLKKKRPGQLPENYDPLSAKDDKQMQELRMDIQSIRNRCSDQEKKVVDLILQGRTFTAIIEELGIDNHQLTLIRESIADKFPEYRNIQQIV